MSYDYDAWAWDYEEITEDEQHAQDEWELACENGEMTLFSPSEMAEEHAQSVRAIIDASYVDVVFGGMVGA